MQNMDFNANFIYQMIQLIVLSTLFTIFIFKFLKPYLQEKNHLKGIEIENAKYDLMMKMDPKLAEEEIDQYVKRYINEYILTKFIIKKADYIRKEEIEQMVRDIDKKILLEISELYIFYIRILTDLTSEEQLIAYVHKKVKEHVLNIVTDYNKPKE